MTKKMLVIALALTLFVAIGSAFANDTPCNNHLLSGKYGFTVEGTKLAGPGPVGPAARNLPGALSGLTGGAPERHQAQRRTTYRRDAHERTRRARTDRR